MADIDAHPGDNIELNELHCEEEEEVTYIDTEETGFGGGEERSLLAGG